MDLSNIITEQHLEMLGLRLLLLVVNCEKHVNQSKIWQKIPKIIECLFNLDIEIVKSHEIYRRLTKSDFMRHSTIIIMINCYHFPCRKQNLSNIIKAIECNEYLRYKLKVICAFYEMKEEFVNGRNLAFGFFVNTMFADYNNFLLSNLENTFLFQDCHKGSGDLMIKNILEIVKYRPFISAQELEGLLKNFCAIMALSKGNAEMYFYSVNPALAIIINNYHFSNPNIKYGMREGSEKDVLHLIHQFQISRTPHIVIQDFKSSEILKLVQSLRHKDLKPLKCLYFITMTHATKNNIIYTNDGELNFITDILQPLQSNTSLRESHITFVNVHCRGNLNGLYIDPDDSNTIGPTKIPQLQPNTSVLYSVPDLMVSPRHRNSGTPFVKSFSKAYGKLECSANIVTLYENTSDDLKNHLYYATLDCFGKSAELVVADATKAHCIKPMPTNALETVPCLEAIKKDFHGIFNKGNTNIINICSENQQPQLKTSTKPFCLFANQSANKAISTELTTNETLIKDRQVDLNKERVSDSQDSDLEEQRELEFNRFMQNLITLFICRRDANRARSISPEECFNKE